MSRHFSDRNRDTDRYERRSRRSRSRSRTPDFEREERRKKESEENFVSFLRKRREQRIEIAARGVTGAWERSPCRPAKEELEDRNSEFQYMSMNQVADNDGKLSEDESFSSDDNREKKSSEKKAKKKAKKNKKEKKEKEKEKKKKKKKKHKKSSSSSSETEEEVAWVERTKGDDDDNDYGPVLPQTDDLLKKERMDFGKALLRGEGEAMAAYIQEGKRIPRRGEIGLKSEEIEKFETSGYVMSGSRHRRMEAVRLRKENQVYSADEKAALARFNHEERTKREVRILAQFRELVGKKKEGGGPDNPSSSKS